MAKQEGENQQGLAKFLDSVLDGVDPDVQAEFRKSKLPQTQPSVSLREKLANFVRNYFPDLPPEDQGEVLEKWTESTTVKPGRLAEIIAGNRLIIKRIIQRIEESEVQSGVPLDKLSELDRQKLDKYKSVVNSILPEKPLTLAERHAQKYYTQSQSPELPWARSRNNEITRPIAARRGQVQLGSKNIGHLPNYDQGRTQPIANRRGLGSLGQNSAGDVRKDSSLNSDQKKTRPKTPGELIFGKKKK